MTVKNTSSAIAAVTMMWLVTVNVYGMMPIMFAATFYELFKNHELLHVTDIPLFAVGFIMSFVTALVVVKAFLKFVSRHDFTSFAIYRIVFGVLVLWYFW